MNAIINNLDASFLSSEEILALILPTELLSLSARIRKEVVDELPHRIVVIEEDADLRSDPEDVFDEVRSYAGHLEKAFQENDELQEQLSGIGVEIDQAISRVAARKENISNEWEGEDVAPSEIAESFTGRSIFSDVDE